MATISNPIVSNTINSSYVLIENASFPPRLGNGGIHTLSAPLVSILHCHGAEVYLPMGEVEIFDLVSHTDVRMDKIYAQCPRNGNRGRFGAIRGCLSRLAMCVAPVLRGME